MFLLILYYNFGSVVVHAVTPKWARFAFKGYATAVQVEFYGAMWANGIAHSVINFNTIACYIAVGAGPIVCPDVSVAH